MIVDHVGITCADLEAAKRFYDMVLATLGHRRLMDVGVAVGYGSGTTAERDKIANDCRQSGAFTVGSVGFNCEQKSKLPEVEY